MTPNYSMTTSRMGITHLFPLALRHYFHLECPFQLTSVVVAEQSLARHVLQSWRIILRREVKKAKSSIVTCITQQVTASDRASLRAVM